MRSQLERADLFLNDVPDPFLREVVGSLGSLYPKTFDQTCELPGGYQRYLRPHLLRTHGEISLITSARRHKLITETHRNRSKDTHALILTEHCAITLSRTGGPGEPPRWARFRISYAGAATYHLPFVEFPEEESPVVVGDDDPRLYVVICHGPQPGHWRELGYVYANFVGEDGLSYTGQGIDLLTRYSAQSSTSSIEEVQEPGFELDEDAEENSA